MTNKITTAQAQLKENVAAQVAAASADELADRAYMNLGEAGDCLRRAREYRMAAQRQNGTKNRAMYRAEAVHQEKLAEAADELALRYLILALEKAEAQGEAAEASWGQLRAELEARGVKPF